MAGAVLGGAAGPSAVYYNPALINEKEANRLSLSMNLMSMQYTKVENLAGTETKTDRFNFLIQQKFISYTGNAKKNKKITYEVAIFHLQMGFSILLLDMFNIFLKSLLWPVGLRRTSIIYPLLQDQPTRKIYSIPG